MSKPSVLRASCFGYFGPTLLPLVSLHHPNLNGADTIFSNEIGFFFHINHKLLVHEQFINAKVLLVQKNGKHYIV